MNDNTEQPTDFTERAHAWITEHWAPLTQAIDRYIAAPNALPHPALGLLRAASEHSGKLASAVMLLAVQSSLEDHTPREMAGQVGLAAERVTGHRFDTDRAVVATGRVLVTLLRDVTGSDDFAGQMTTHALA